MAERELTMLRCQTRDVALDSGLAGDAMLEMRINILDTSRVIEEKM